MSPDSSPPRSGLGIKGLGAVMRPFQEFAESGVLSGVVLLACTVIALAWANSPLGDSYFHLWETSLVLGPADAPFTASLHHWVNDGLMAVFFLLVGLEIKRELLVGELSTPRQAALPIAAAIGGMIVPALIYAAVNAGGPATRGWGIPMATDIAFALGVLTLLGPRVPIGLKVFLTALAIVDDMGAVGVIAVFYTDALNLGALAAAGVALAVLVALNRAGVRALTPYIVVGNVLWVTVLMSGVHATISGVLLALTIPSSTRLDSPGFSSRARRLLDAFDQGESGDGLLITSPAQRDAVHALEVAAGEVQAPLLRLEHSLHKVVAFGIMPLFALANAGVRLGEVGTFVTNPATIGVALGLVLGKPIGIMLFSWLTVRFGLAALPTSVNWRQVHGASWLGGIGFTMSLFVAGLAFGQSELNDAAKVGVLGASTVAGIIGWILVRRGTTAPAPRSAAGG